MLYNIAKRLVSAVDNTNKWVGEKAAYLVIPMMIFISLEVILRYVFNRPTIWVWDINIQLQSAFVFITGAYAALLKKFVTVDVWVQKMRPKARARIDAITSVVAFFGIGILVWQASIGALDSVKMKENYTSLLNPPLYPLRILVFIGVALLLLQILSHFLKDLFTICGKEPAASPEKQVV